MDFFKSKQEEQLKEIIAVVLKMALDKKSGLYKTSSGHVNWNLVKAEINQHIDVVLNIDK